MKLFKKLRYYARLVTVFINRRKLLIFLGMLSSLLIFYLWPKLVAATQEKPVKIGLVGRFTPSELPLEIQELISQGLTRVAPDGTVEPSLAASWEVKNQGKEYQFVLKKDLFWHDKTLLTAKDINYNFIDVATTVLGEDRIIFLLKEPFSPFPSIVSRPVFKKGFVGTGEYQVASMAKSGEVVEKIVLEAEGKNKPELVYRFYPTEEAARVAFKLGQVDILKHISHPADLEDWPNLKLTDFVDRSVYIAILYNTRKGLLEEKSIRQALAYAIKKPWPVRALSPIGPKSFFYNPGVKTYDYDLAKAKELLDKAQEDIEEDSKLKKIELMTVSSYLETAESIARDWQELGIQAEVKVIM